MEEKKYTFRKIINYQTFSFYDITQNLHSYKVHHDKNKTVYTSLYTHKKSSSSVGTNNWIIPPSQIPQQIPQSKSLCALISGPDDNRKARTEMAALKII